MQSAGQEYIAVEVKSFKKPSLLNFFYEALGQYLIYYEALLENNSPQTLYLAISARVYQRINEFPFLRERIAQFNIKLIVVDISQKKVKQWLK